MDIIDKLKRGNRKWSKAKFKSDPEYFQNMSKGQNPDILWIGCADSRVPANEVTGTRAGDIFVHRNIANLVIHTDMNLLSVLDYGVNVIKVKHIIVCGHYLCGGVKAAMSGTQNGLVDNWIRHIKDVYRLYEDELEAIEDFNKKFDRLVELNVYEQVFDLSKTSIVQNAWDDGRNLKLHGWVFDTRNGLINDLGINFDSTTPLPKIYKIDSKIVLQ